MKSEHCFIYILSNGRNTVLYTGFTTDLIRRVWEHKQHVVKGFTQKYNVDKLVYYEVFEDMEEALKREKQVKGGSRQKKLDLINKMNPNWEDLYPKLIS